MHHVRTRALPAALAVTLLALAIAAPLARASQITSYEAAQDMCGVLYGLRISAAPGEVNHVSAAAVSDVNMRYGDLCGSVPGQLLVADTALISSGCVATPGPVALCSSQRLYELRIDLDDGDDVADVSALLVPAVISGGDGDDRIVTVNHLVTDVIECGPGVDTVVADPGDEVAADCEQVVRP